jgi:DNA-binding LacI/PurR family transcriptional regulator
MTLDEMAKALGVSKSTVSRALSGKGRIGEQTRERIIEFAKTQNGLNARRDVGIQQKYVNATRNLGVILPADVYSNCGLYFQECILGICETASFFDYDIVIATGTANDLTSIRTLVDKKKVDGIILTRSIENDKALEYLSEIGFPVGMTGLCQGENVIQVDTDNEAAAQSLTSLLIGRGYRRFALVIGNMEYLVNKSRYNGFCNALKQHGVALEKQRVISGSLKLDMDMFVEDLIDSKVDCIICGDDIICTRVMSALLAKGYRIPKDTSVASLYNSPNLECFSPAVTAVNVSAQQVGNMICRQMINFLEGREFQKKTIMDYEILVRKSAGGIS